MIESECECKALFNFELNLDEQIALQLILSSSEIATTLHSEFLTFVTRLEPGQSINPTIFNDLMSTFGAWDGKQLELNNYAVHKQSAAFTEYRSEYQNVGKYL